MKVATPPFPWVGGKTALLPTILDRLPNDSERYVECFGGGGAILFAKRHAPFEVYNDYNGYLSNMMWQIKNNSEYFLNVVLKQVENTSIFNRIKLQIDRLFINSRDEFMLNDIVFRSGGEYVNAFDQVKRLVNKASNEREIRHVMSLLDKMFVKIKQRDGSRSLGCRHVL